MLDWKRKVQMIVCLLPASAVLVCSFLSLRTYVKPTFQAEAISTKVNKNKNKTVALPITVEQKADSVSESKAIKTVAKTTDANGYEDGVYYGTGTGFDGKIKVKVTIKKGKINRIKIVSSQDGKDYVEKASLLLRQMIKKQSTNVDAVSGATYSSNGLIEAVRNALNKAEKTNKKSDVKSDKSSNKDTTSKKNETGKNSANKNETPSGEVLYKDGVYYGTGEGYRDDITVAVCVSNHSIQYIMITEASDDTAFLTKAKSILTTVVKKQSADVDVVSGATYSSRGIIEAIKNALAAAKNTTVSESEAPSPTATPTSAPTPAMTELPASASENPETKIYANGEFQGDAICNPNIYADFDAYTLSLKITVDNDRITSVTDVKGLGALYDSSNDWYIKRAVNGTNKYPGVVGQIVSKGTYESVDAVSGATCSSNAIIEAVKKALETAKK